MHCETVEDREHWRWTWRDKVYTKRMVYLETYKIERVHQDKNTENGYVERFIRRQWFIGW